MGSHLLFLYSSSPPPKKVLYSSDDSSLLFHTSLGDLALYTPKDFHFLHLQPLSSVPLHATAMTVFHRFWDNIFPIFFHAFVLILLFPWPCSHKLSTVAAAACQKKQLLRMTLLFPDLPASPSYPLVILFGTIIRIQRLTAKQCAVPDNDLVNSDSLISREKLLGGWAGSDENHVITTVEITCCIREDTARRRCLSGNPCWFFSWLATRKSFPFPFSSFLFSSFFHLSFFYALKQLSPLECLFAISHRLH